MPSIFITGAASGIGRASAQRFAAEGWRLGLADIDAETLSRVHAELASAQLQVYVVDVCDEQALAAALADFCAEEGLDVLLNNAEVALHGALHEISLAAHRQLIEVNVLGLIHAAWLAYPHLCRRQGLLINMSSTTAIFGTPQRASYSASKFAVRGLTEALANEWADDGVKVCDLMPPLSAATDPETAEQSWAERLRLGPPDVLDIAEQVWQLTQERRLHNLVGLPFKLLSTLSGWLPDTANRRIMQLLSRR